MAVNEFMQNSYTRETGFKGVRPFSNAIFVHKIAQAIPF